MKNKFFSIISFMILIFGLSLLADTSPEQKKMKKALVSGNNDYFEKVSFEEFQAANNPAKEGAKTMIARNGIKSIPAIVGAFTNKEANVRKAIYSEMLFPDFFKELGDNPLKKMKEDKELKAYLELARKTLFSVKETEEDLYSAWLKAAAVYNYNLKDAIHLKIPESIVVMDPEYFQKSNLELEQTVIGRYGKRSIKVLVKVLENEKANRALKFQVIDSLYFSKAGGIKQILKKPEARRKKAEVFFQIADKEQNQELKNKLIELAGAYYAASDEITTAP